MLNNRLQEKNNLLIKLGALFRPLQHLAENPDKYDAEEKVRIEAQYQAEHGRLQKEFSQFCQSEPGYLYYNAITKFMGALQRIANQLGQGDIQLSGLVRTQLAEAQAAIEAIPIPRESIILEARTPFSTYCLLKDLCETTTESLVWIDAYLDMNIFHRFLRGVRAEVKITLITSEPSQAAGDRDKRRWNEFLDISQLFGQERGHLAYQLLIHQSLLHDRWLLLDDQRFYNLGGSAKDAGNKQYFTVARLDTSELNLQAIQDHINNGKEYFGPNTPNHTSLSKGP